MHGTPSLCTGHTGPIACIEAGRMEQEGQFFAALGPVTKLQVTSESLKLFTGEEPSDFLIIFGILE